MKLKSLLRTKKFRKYPIHYDDKGLSLRSRCFALFEEGMRPAEVVRELGMKSSTAATYFKQWKRLGPNFEARYAYIRELLKKSAPDRERVLDQ